MSDDERQRIANYLVAIFDISDSAAWAHAGQLLPIAQDVTEAMMTRKEMPHETEAEL